MGTAKCARESLKPEGFGSEIWAAADRGDIMHELAPLLTRSLLSAGVDTTVYGLSAMLYGFATHPDQWAALRRNPNLARVAFDEALRWESPVQMLFRKTSADVEISGTVIPAETRVLLCYAAANRDPRRWDNPDRFDLSRDPRGTWPRDGDPPVRGPARGASAGRVPARGSRDPCDVHRTCGTRTSLSQQHAARMEGHAASAESRLVVVNEFVFDCALERLSAGAGSTYLIHGEAGTGKTHLLRSTLDAARRRGWTCLYAAAHEYDHDIPYATVRTSWESSATARCRPIRVV